MLEANAKAVRKVISQYITVYQTIMEFSFEDLWLDITIKHNKADPDNMFDDINAHLIEVCDRYLKDTKLNLDKFQLATIVMDLYSQTVSELDAPFYVRAKESKWLVKEYIKNNKELINKAKEIRKENESLEKEVEENKKKRIELNKQFKEPVEVSKISEAKPKATQSKKPKWDWDTNNLQWTFTF